MWPLQVIMQYCKNLINFILTWALSVDMVHQRVKFLSRYNKRGYMVQQTTGYKIQMFVLFQKTRSLMLGKYTVIPIYRSVLNVMLF